MKSFLVLTVFNLITFISNAQLENRLILLTVKNDRSELAKALKFLNTCETKLICVNVDLTNCDVITHFPSNHFESTDTLAVTSPSQPEKILVRELEATSSLLLPSELRKLVRNEYDALIGCPHLYPETVTTGFVNLIANQQGNLVEKFQISNRFRNEKATYHFAVEIAFKINENATSSFIKLHPNIVPIDFKRKREFSTYRIEHFYENKEHDQVLKDKVIILGVDKTEDYRMVSKGKKMTSSEIFANIVFQLVENTVNK